MLLIYIVVFKRECKPKERHSHLEKGGMQTKRKGFSFGEKPKLHFNLNQTNGTKARQRNVSGLQAPNTHLTVLHICCQKVIPVKI